MANGAFNIVAASGLRTVKNFVVSGTLTAIGGKELARLESLASVCCKWALIYAPYRGNDANSKALVKNYTLRNDNGNSLYEPN